MNGTSQGRKRQPSNDERDLEVLEICGMINEGGFALDADGLPSGVSGELFGR